MELSPGFMQLSTQLRDTTWRDSELLSNLSGGITEGQGSSDPAITCRQAFQPFREIDAEADLIDHRGARIFDHGFLPDLLVLIEAIDSIDGATSLAPRHRGEDIPAVQARSNPAPTTNLRHGESSQNGGEGAILTSVLCKRHERDTRVRYRFLDGFVPIISMQAAEGSENGSPDRRQHGQEPGLPVIERCLYFSC